MGCAGSKLDELEVVDLCRCRSKSLEDAINYRYALAKAHESYIQSLRSVGLSLHRFFLMSDPPPPSSSPILALPTQRKGGPFHPPIQQAPFLPSHSPLPVAAEVSKSIPEDAHRNSNSGHLEFHTSDEDELSDDDDDDDGPLHSDGHDSPFHHRPENMDGAGTTNWTTTTYFNFAKKGAPTSAVTYEQRPFGVENGNAQYGGFNPSSTASPSYGYYNGNPYMSQNPNYYGAGGGGGGGEGISSYPYESYSYPTPYAYPQGYGGFFDSSLPVVAAPPPAPSPQRAPPPPPSPPRASTWDFLNPFESFQNYQQQSYTPSRSSRDLREEEGIPDLEDEEHEVVKEAYIDQKFAPGASSSNANGADGHSFTKGVVMEEGRRSVGGEDVQHHTRGIDTLEREVTPTMKNVVGDEVLPQKKIIPGSRSIPDALHEIKAQFDSASLSCKEIGMMLEVGKLPYHRRKYEEVSFKVRYAITPSLSTAATSKYLKEEGVAESSNSIYLNFNEDKGMAGGHLSQTLQKLYIWEKKLFEEVRAEEEMRLFHDRKCNQLKRLNEKGAEPFKIDSTRAQVKKLSTKIRVAIQVVDSISNRISKLRDEELWPELHELIKGLFLMWQAMTKCHKNQFQAAVQSTNLDAALYPFTENLTDEHMKATMQLAMELLNWIDIFSSWIDAQRKYVKSLNSWLIKCLPNEQEETADGLAPFSPGRLGAPPVFVICNYWSQTIDRISEREVLDAMQSLTSSVRHVWKQHSDARNHGMVAKRAKDKFLKGHEKDDQKFHKTVDAINKRLQVAKQRDLPGNWINIDLSTDPIQPNHLHESVQQIFEAMERFSEKSLKAYGELCVRCDEECSKVNVRVS